MKKNYVIYAQFVNKNARFDEKAQAAVKEGISNYNTKSLIARNPKQIINYSFSEDGKTLQIELLSEAELPVPTKALRLLSSFLVAETTLDKYLSGKQLFKMTTGTVSKDALSEVEQPSSKQIDDTDSKVMNIKEFKSLCLEDKQIAIYELLCEIRRQL